MTIKDKELVSIFDNRWKDSASLWEEIEKIYKKNKKEWLGKPDWLASIPRKRSKTQDNRIFLATESQINKLTARPVKPMVAPANGSDEAKTIARNLQSVFIEHYRDRNVKKEIKRGLRFVHFSRLVVLKPFWNMDIDDVDVVAVDPRKVRFTKTATKEQQAEFVAEIIDDKTIMDMIEKFPDRENDILSAQGISKRDAMVNNPTVEYHEVWIGDGVFWKFKNKILKKQRNPHWDFKGLLVTPEEVADLEQIDPETKVPRVNGQRRRQKFQEIRSVQEEREAQEKEADAPIFEQYLFNHFDTVRKPYIFGTVLEVESKPIGETSLIEITTSLQHNISKRKRQIADNADFVNGITKVDTAIVSMSRADAQKAHYDPEGLVYGHGVSNGVKREFGSSLPEMVFTDLQDSRSELDAIFGTTDTFRGEQGKGETATGRAILREESLSRLDEMSSLIDNLGRDLYNWWFQMMKVHYTESHLVKPLGATQADETIELMQDDLQEGIEVKILPGQTLPEDKVFKAEKASEDVKAGIIDNETYLEMSGGYENPQEIAKRATLKEVNPLSLIDIDEDDSERLVKAMQLMVKLEQIKAQAAQPQQPPQDGGAPPTEDGGADQGQAQILQRIQQIVSSTEFAQLPKEEQLSVIQRLKQQALSVGGRT